MIYAIEATGLGFVKFGKAKNPKARLHELKTGCPVPIRLLATWDCPNEREGEIHRYFSSARNHGEWFNVTDDVADFVDTMMCPNATEERKTEVLLEILRPAPQTQITEFSDNAEIARLRAEIAGLKEQLAGYRRNRVEYMRAYRKTNRKD